MGKMAVRARRGAGRLKAGEAAQLMDRLLDAAQALFVEQGFANTTMEAIAREAGSSTQTIYTRFANKTELLEAVVRRVVEGTVAAHTAATSVDPRGVKPRIYLTSLGKQIVKILSTDGVGLTRLSFSEAHRSAEIQRAAAVGYGRGVGLIRAALERWTEDGVLTVAGDLDRAANICLSMMTDRPRIRAVLGQPFSEVEAEAYVGQAVDLFLNGCARSGD